MEFSHFWAVRRQGKDTCCYGTFSKVNFAVSPQPLWHRIGWGEWLTPMWIHFMPWDGGARPLLMTHYTPDSADGVTKCLSGIFKILDGSLLHSLSGFCVTHRHTHTYIYTPVHVGSRRTQTHTSPMATLYNFSAFHSRPRTQSPLLCSPRSLLTSGLFFS